MEEVVIRVLQETTNISVVVLSWGHDTDPTISNGFCPDSFAGACVHKFFENVPKNKLWTNAKARGKNRCKAQILSNTQLKKNEGSNFVGSCPIRGTATFPKNMVFSCLISDLVRRTVISSQSCWNLGTSVLQPGVSTILLHHQSISL